MRNYTLLASLIIFSLFSGKSFSVDRNSFAIDFGTSGLGIYYSNGLFFSDGDTSSYNLRFGLQYIDNLDIRGVSKKETDIFANLDPVTGAVLSARYLENKTAENTVSYVSAIVDYYPNESGLVFSMGLAYNNSKFSQEITTENFEGKGDITTNAKLDFKKPSLYLAAGYGLNPRFSKKGMSLRLTLGMFLQTKPALSVETDGGSVFSQSDIDNRESLAKTSLEEVNGFKTANKRYIPNISLGFEYKI